MRYGPTIDLTGKRFGRLKVIRYSKEKSLKREVYWECICDCGKVTFKSGSKMKAGATRSCGCLAKELASKRLKTHGQSNSKEFNAWSAMIQRCTNKNHYAYNSYGGRGIKICKRWLVFANFFKDIGEIPKGYSLDRIDNNKGYFPKNVKVSSYKEQNNNRRSTLYFQYKNKTKTLNELAKISGLNTFTILARIKRGWSVEKSLMPITKRTRVK